MKHGILLGIAAGAVLLPQAAKAQAVGVSENQVIAPLAGRMYRPADVAPVGFHGTDLGITFKHRGRLEIFFGDTWKDKSGLFIGPTSGVLKNDAAGFICLEQGPAGSACATEFPFPTGNHVYVWAAYHPNGTDPVGEELPMAWDRGGPPIHFNIDPATRAPVPLALVTPGTGAELSLAAGETPVAAFSNYPTSTSPVPSTAAAFGVFTRNDYPTCAQDSDCAPFNTPGACDKSLSTKTILDPDGNGPVPGVLIPCVELADLACPLSSRGLCRDTGSSVAGGDDTPERRLLPVIRNLRVGSSPDAAPYRFNHRPWPTNRFANVTARTVEGFLPATGQLTNPAPADGLGPTMNEKVLLWGRPTFVGDRNKGRSAKLYFAYSNMPQYANGAFTGWQLNYFTGVNSSNVPLFDTDEKKAKPLSLDGNVNGDSVEAYDVINQTSVAWVEPLKKWVMLYGGDVFFDTNPDLNHLFIALAFGIDLANVRNLSYNSMGSIMFRTADVPWGPWSPPQNLFPANLFEEAAAYIENGIMRSPPRNETGNHTFSCDPTTVIDGTAGHCVPHEPPGSVTRYGSLYGVNLVDTWTVDQSAPQGGRAAADIYWNVSTWDPYQVIVMRSRLYK